MIQYFSDKNKPFEPNDYTNEYIIPLAEIIKYVNKI